MVKYFLVSGLFEVTLKESFKKKYLTLSSLQRSQCSINTELQKRKGRETRITYLSGHLLLCVSPSLQCFQHLQQHLVTRTHAVCSQGCDSPAGELDETQMDMWTLYGYAVQKKSLGVTDAMIRWSWNSTILLQLGVRWHLKNGEWDKGWADKNTLVCDPITEFPSRNPIKPRNGEQKTCTSQLLL